MAVQPYKDFLKDSKANKFTNYEDTTFGCQLSGSNYRQTSLFQQEFQEKSGKFMKFKKNKKIRRKRIWKDRFLDVFD